MTAENDNKDQVEPSGQKEDGKKIHQTHFPVIKIPLKDGDYESRFEWIDLGNGHSKLVPKKKEVFKPEETS